MTFLCRIATNKADKPSLVCSLGWRLLNMFFLCYLSLCVCKKKLRWLFARMTDGKFSFTQPGECKLFTWRIDRHQPKFASRKMITIKGLSWRQKWWFIALSFAFNGNIIFMFVSSTTYKMWTLWWFFFSIVTVWQ